MRKTKNVETISGRIYDFSVEEKVTGESSKNPGTTYIGGKIDVATDDACMNIVTVEYTYVTETTKAGKKNSTFAALKKIINEGKTILKDGPDQATMVKLDTSLGLNDFYTDRNGEEILVSAKRNNGGFVTIVNSLGDEKTRNTFEFDMLINGTKYVEADPEKNIAEDYLIVKGAVFDFRNAILPVELIVRSKGGIKYFESLDASPKNLTFTKVWGNINSETIKTVKEEESAFGEPVVKEYSKTIKEWVITGTSKAEAVYEIGDEKNGITEEEIKKALQDREVYLADIKKRQDEYKASLESEVPFKDDKTTANAPAAAGGFNF